MTLYRKFGQGLAILCCIAMFAMTAVLIVTGGISNQDEETKELVYFYERADVQAAAFVALSFLISTVANAITADLPQVAAIASLVPLVMTFYEMAFENLNFILAAILLLLTLIHVASNFIAWWDLHEWNKTHPKAPAAEEAAPKAKDAK